MIRKTFILAFILLCFQFTVKAQGIKIYSGSLSDGKALAKKEHKFLIVDGFTDWCGWCKFMDKNIYPQKEVGDFFNANFIFLEINMEQGEGKDVARQYRLNEYPSFLFFDSLGSFVHYYFGASTTAPAFIKLGQTAMDTMHNCRGLAYRLFKGEQDTAFIKELIKSTYYYADPKIIENALAVYWTALPNTKLIEKENWDLFKYYEENVNSLAFDYIYAHKAEFQTRYHEKGDSNVIYIKAAMYMKKAADAKDEAMLMRAREIALQSNDKQTIYTACVNEFPFYLQKGNLNDFYSDVDHFIQRFGSDWMWGISSTMGTATNDKKVLEKALGYVSQDLKKNKTYYNTDTYAHILFKLGRIKEAYASANDAMTLASNINDYQERARDTGQTGDLLEQIKKSMDKN